VETILRLPKNHTKEFTGLRCERILAWFWLEGRLSRSKMPRPVIDKAEAFATDPFDP
jgi:hypothetical protein